MRQHVDAHVLQRGAKGHRLVPPEERLLDAQRLTSDAVMLGEGGGVGDMSVSEKETRAQTNRFISWTFTHVEVFRRAAGGGVSAKAQSRPRSRCPRYGGNAKHLRGQTRRRGLVRSPLPRTISAA